MNLPRVYQNRNIGSINNDQEYFYSALNNKGKRKVEKVDVDKKINNLFKSNKYIYKINVHIVTDNQEMDTTIIGKINNNLITIENNLIPIRDIIDINEK